MNTRVESISLIPVVAHTDDTYDKYVTNLKRLERRLLSVENFNFRIDSVSTKVLKRNGYAKVDYSGYLKDEYSDLSALDVAMLCDGGFNWFGGSSELIGNNFNVTVYID